MTDAAPMKKMPQQDKGGQEGVLGDMAEAAAEYAPSQVAPYLRKLAPILDKLGDTLNAAYPHLLKVWTMLLKFWAILKPYHPEEFVPALCGLVLCFFGGHFVTTIAAVEAFRICGWTQTRKAINVLWSDYLVVKEAYAKDNELDEDGDGIADVHQISKKELATRKLAVVMKSMSPGKVSDALGSITAGCMGVLATLRVQFAHSITLGSSIGDTLSKFIIRHARPAMSELCPKEYSKWIDPSIEYFCKGLGVSFAMFVQRTISAFHSAIRGGQMFTKGVLHYLVRHKYIDAELVEEGSGVYTAVEMGLAALGFYWQFSRLFGLPFPMGILLFPASMVEWTLTWLVHTTSA